MSDLTIGVVMAVLGGEYFGGILGGIERVARERDTRLLVFRGTPGDVAAAPFAREVRGWIAVHSPDGLADLARLGLPLVTVAYHDREVGFGYRAVVADNGQGVRDAVRHLIAHGHRRIAFMGWLEYPAIAERYEGYRDALTESGLPCSPELVIGVQDNHVASGRAGARQLLEGAWPCTAVVAGTDRNAVGAMEVLQAAGLRVPEDVAVVGFDDLTDASLADPPLTTLRTRFDELGRRAANLILDEISGIAVPRTVHRLPVALIRRRSCGCDMADNVGSPPGADALAASGNSALAAHLVRMALFPVPSEPGRVPGDIWPGVVTLIDGIDAALAGDPEPSPAALREAWQQAVRLTPDVDVLRAMSTLLSRAGAQRLAATPADPIAQRLAAFLARSELELWRARVAYRHAGMTHLEELTQNSPTVAMIVLSGKPGQAQELDWLRLTPARWGCLALYPDANRTAASTLTVAGTYRRSGPPVPDRGTQFVAGAFPPAEWYPAPGSAVGADVLMLVPVASASRDWGVLVLRGPIDAHGGYTAQRPNNMAMWGALLAAALERDALAAELAELADEDRKRAEQALRRSEATLAEAQRLSHMGSWVWDRASGTISWSAEMFRLFDLNSQHGPPSREIIDQRLHPDDRERVHSVRENAVREKVDIEHEYRILLPDGTLRYVQATCHPVLNAGGDVVEVFGTARDVTERKHAEHALRETEAALAHVTRVTTLGEVTASIAHEVNQPLLGMITSASSCSRWLGAQPPNLQRAQRALERIIKAGTRASAVIDRVRTLVKRQPMRAAPVDLNEIVRDVIAMVRHELQRSGVSLKTRLAEELPAVPGDRVQLQQVVLNLILNAIEATREIEGRSRQVWVASRFERGTAVHVEVRDSGVGFARDSQPRVFEAFYTTKPSGLGMGLSISRSIIEAHGGRISARPNSPHGAIFQFSLPLVSEDTGVV